MSSRRDAVDEKIMDAALDRILQVGIRRSSLDDIAKRSGVNRVTIYRRFAGKENLVDAVLERETQRMLAEVTAIVVTSAEVDVRIEETVLHVLRQTRMHQLVGRLLTVAPEEALAFYTVRGPRWCRWASATSPGCSNALRSWSSSPATTPCRSRK
ncbi:TetR/AcrR family transcriptional regulator [Nocardia gipuzkoensis]